MTKEEMEKEIATLKLALVYAENDDTLGTGASKRIDEAKDAYYAKLTEYEAVYGK